MPMHSCCLLLIDVEKTIFIYCASIQEKRDWLAACPVVWQWCQWSLWPPCLLTQIQPAAETKMHIRNLATLIFNKDFVSLLGACTKFCVSSSFSHGCLSQRSAAMLPACAQCYFVQSLSRCMPWIAAWWLDWILRKIHTDEFEMKG